MKNLKFSFLFFSFLFFSNFLNAQCTLHGVDGGNASSVTSIVNAPNGLKFGQTFQACANGNITVVSISVPASTGAGSIKLRIGTSAIPTTAVLGTAVLATESVTGGVAETITFNLATPFPVVNDGTTVYAIELELCNSGMRVGAQNTNDFGPGNIYSTNVDGTGFLDAPGFELDFGIQIAPATAVPTVGEWGLIILALLILSIGTLFVMQPQLQMAGGQSYQINAVSLGRWFIPFRKGLFAKIWLGIIAALTAVLLVSVYFFGYEMTNADLPMGFVASGVLAFLGQLLVVEKK